MFDQAFNAMLAVHSRAATLKRLHTPSDMLSPIRITPSNYFKLAAAASGMTVEGREFIISKSSIQIKFTPLLKVGDRLIDQELGTLTIKQIEELYDFGGSIMGWRVGTG